MITEALRPIRIDTFGKLMSISALIEPAEGTHWSGKRLMSSRWVKDPHYVHLTVKGEDNIERLFCKLNSTSWDMQEANPGDKPLCPDCRQEFDELRAELLRRRFEIGYA